MFRKQKQKTINSMRIIVTSIETFFHQSRKLETRKQRNRFGQGPRHRNSVANSTKQSELKIRVVAHEQALIYFGFLVVIS